MFEIYIMYFVNKLEHCFVFVTFCEKIPTNSLVRQHLEISSNINQFIYIFGVVFISRLELFCKNRK